MNEARENPYSSPQQIPNPQSWLTKLLAFFRLIPRPEVVCRHHFEMDDFVWFMEECVHCGKRQPWPEYRKGKPAP